MKAGSMRWTCSVVAALALAAPAQASTLTELPRGLESDAPAVVGPVLYQANKAYHRHQNNPYELRRYEPRGSRALPGFGPTFRHRPRRDDSPLYSNWASVAATRSLVAMAHVVGVVDEDGSGGAVYPEVADLVVRRGSGSPRRLMRCRRSALPSLVADGDAVAVAGCGASEREPRATVFDLARRGRATRFDAAAGELFDRLALAGRWVALGVGVSAYDPVTGDTRTDPVRVEVRDRLTRKLAYSVPGRLLRGALTDEGALWLTSDERCPTSARVFAPGRAEREHDFGRCVRLRAAGRQILATTYDVDAEQRVQPQRLFVLDGSSGGTILSLPPVFPWDYDGRRVSYAVDTCASLGSFTGGLVHEPVVELARRGSPAVPPACPATAAASRAARVSRLGSTTMRIRCPRGCRGSVRALDAVSGRPLQVGVGYETYLQEQATFNVPRRGRRAATVNLRLSSRPRAVDLEIAVDQPAGAPVALRQRVRLRATPAPPRSLRADLDGDGAREVVRLERRGRSTAVVARTTCRGRPREVELRRTRNAVHRLVAAPRGGVLISTHDPLDLDQPGTGARVAGLTGPCGRPRLLWNHPYDHSVRDPGSWTFDVRLSRSGLTLVEEGFDADRRFRGRETVFRLRGGRYVRAAGRRRPEPARPLAGMADDPVI